MNKTKKTLLSLLAFILPLSACAKNEQTGSSSSSTPSVPATEKPSQTASPSVSEQPSSDKGLHVDSRLSLLGRETSIKMPSVPFILRGMASLAISNGPQATKTSLLSEVIRLTEQGQKST